MEEALKELLASERAYVSQLNKLVESHARALPASKEDVAVVFGNADALRDLHAALLAQLEQGSKEGSKGGGAEVARVFVGNAALLQGLYVTYCEGYARAVAKLAALEAGGGNAAQYLRGCRADLATLLVAPVRRVPRYVALLRDALRADPQREMSAAVACMEEVAARIAEAKRGSENAERILQIQHRMDPAWGTVLLQPQRRFLAEVPHCKVGSGETNVAMFVFNDLILLAEDVEREERPMREVARFVVNRQLRVEQNGSTLVLNGATKVVCMTALDADAVMRAIGPLITERVADEDEVEVGVPAAAAAMAAVPLQPDWDAMQHCAWEGWLDKQSSSGNRFLLRWCQLRGNTLFWHEQKRTTDNPGNPSGSFCFSSDKRVTMDTKKGLPHTLYVEGGSKLYWFRRERRAEMESFVRALSSTEANIDEAVLNYFLQQSPSMVDVMVDCFWREPSPNLSCVVFKSGKKTLGYSWITPGTNNAVWLPVTFHSADPIRVSLYRVPDSAKIAIERKDYKSFSVTHGGSIIVSVPDLLCRRRSYLSQPLTRRKGAQDTGNTLSIALGPRFHDHSRLLLEYARCAQLDIPLLSRSRPLYLSILSLTPQNTYAEVWRSDYVGARDSASWNDVALDVQQLCGGDFDRPVVCNVCSSASSGQDQLLGQAKLHVGALANNKGTVALPLALPERKSNAALHLAQPSFSNRYSLAHYLMGGLALRLVVGVDFSGKPASEPSSLHHASRNGDTYAFALSHTVSHLLSWFPICQRFEAWGLSAAHAPFFELGGTQGEPCVRDVAELMQGYHNAAQYVSFGARQDCQPFIQKVVREAAGAQDDHVTVCLLFVPRGIQVAAVDGGVFFGVVSMEGGGAGSDLSVSLSACRRDPARQMLRQLFHRFPEAVENHFKRRGVVPLQYRGREPATCAQATERSRLDFATPTTAKSTVSVGGAQVYASQPQVVAPPPSGGSSSSGAFFGAAPTKQVVVSVQQYPGAPPIQQQAYGGQYGVPPQPQQYGVPPQPQYAVQPPQQQQYVQPLIYNDPRLTSNYGPGATPAMQMPPQAQYYPPDPRLTQGAPAVYYYGQQPPPQQQYPGRRY